MPVMLGAVGPGQGARGTQCDGEMEYASVERGGTCCSVPQHPHFQLSRGTVLPFWASTAPAAKEAWMG